MACDPVIERDGGREFKSGAIVALFYGSKMGLQKVGGVGKRRVVSSMAWKESEEVRRKKIEESVASSFLI